MNGVDIPPEHGSIVLYGNNVTQENRCKTYSGYVRSQVNR